MKLSKLHINAILPNKKHLSDAGWDLYTPEKIELMPWEQKIIGIGWKIEGHHVSFNMPNLNICYQVWPKSGLDAKYGLHTGSGIIDSGYRGEILVLLKNMSDNPIIISAGSPIAQLIPVLIDSSYMEEVSDISEVSDRGESGGILTAYNKERKNNE